MTDERVPPVVAIDSRVRALEERAIADDGLHKNLVVQDGLTATAVHELTAAINDPRQGLIVELDRFRTEVRVDREAMRAEAMTDRRVTRAWIRGASAVLGVIFTLVTVLSPWIQRFLESTFGVKP